MTNLAAILRSLAPTPEAAAVALDKLHPLELAGSTVAATAKPRATTGETQAASLFPLGFHHAR